MTEKRIITIKDIARELNISPAAVSKALRDMPDISEDTRKKVREMAEKLNYSKNYIASTLRTGRSDTIGFIMDITNPVYAKMFQGVRTVCNNNDFNVLYASSNEIDIEEEMRAVDSMIKHQVDGIIVCPTASTDKNMEKMLKLDIPIVFIGRTLGKKDVYSVVTSDTIGGYLVCEHLLSKGYKKFVYLTVSLNFYPAKDRYDGFVNCLKDHGIPESAVTVRESIASWKYAYSNTARIMEELPDTEAIFAFDDVLAKGALKYLREHNVKIPQDVAVIGYNNTEDCEISTPSISTVDILGAEQGRLGAKMLIELINGRQIPETARQTVLNPMIISREST